MQSLKWLNLRCFYDEMGHFMTEIRFDPFCNITQEPQDLQRLWLVLMFAVKHNKILLHQFTSKQVSAQVGSFFDHLAIANYSVYYSV